MAHRGNVVVYNAMRGGGKNTRDDSSSGEQGKTKGAWL